MKVIVLPSRWIDASALDGAMARPCGGQVAPGWEFRLHRGCRLLLDAIIRLLAHANQAVEDGFAVRIVFEEGRCGTMGYLDRMGFFDHLSSDVEVSPPRPAVSGADLHRGGNQGLVEIAAIRRGVRDQGLPGRLADRLVGACGGRADVDRLDGAVGTIISELVGNVHEHGGPRGAGFAALQVYRQGDMVKVVVSDQGRGLIETLRPALEARSSRFGRMNDTALLLEAFRNGLSRHADQRRGQGLMTCAARALRFRATLEVRLASQNLKFVPGDDGYGSDRAFAASGLVPMRGTHISVEFATS